MSSEDHNVDYEEVFRVLPKSFRDHWKDNPDVLLYLADLGSQGLQRLSQEPDRLSEERSSVLEQTQDLAFHNYKTFIQAAECSHKIFQDFNIIEKRLDSLVDKLPVFKEKCGEFGKEAQKINARWRQASSTLSKHPQLLEFLEMPQLMDTYVRSGYYDEALELSSYVKRLERKHSDIPLIKSIVQDVQASANAMLSHLLMKLRTNIKLPDCLKVVGYLRRMDVFNESELRIKFLQARDAWFQKVINDNNKNDPYEHVIKVIESSRVHLFDITTQYRAIFSDDDPLLLVREDSKGNCAIFHSWITYKISWFLCVLQEDISADLGGRIDSVLAQCMYFGLSFSRVNIDFRPLLVPIFQNIALKKLCSSLDRATKKFENIMETFTFSAYTNTTLLVASLSEESLQPPVSLLDFHPLAQYCNDVLSALNELKLCCSYSMSSDIIAAVTNSLDSLIKTLVNIHTKWRKRLNDVETENFNKLCFVLSSDLIPHLDRCLTMIFPPENISKALGVTTLEFKKFEHLCKLNIIKILEPLQVILPSKDEEEDLLMIKIHTKDEGNNTEATTKIEVDTENNMEATTKNEVEIENNMEATSKKEIEMEAMSKNEVEIENDIGATTKNEVKIENSTEVQFGEKIVQQSPPVVETNKSLNIEENTLEEETLMEQETVSTKLELNNSETIDNNSIESNSCSKSEDIIVE